MRRFDEDGLLDRMAERGALTAELMASLGARIAAYHDRLDPAVTEALAVALPEALEAFVELVARRAGAGAVRRCHGDLHLRNIVLIDGRPVPFDAIEFSQRIASIDVLYD